MNNFYATKKRLTSLCLLAVGLLSYNANSQCTTPVTTLSENFSSFNNGDAFPLNCWSFVANPAAPAMPPIPLGYINEDTSVTPSEKAVAMYSYTYTTRSFYLISPAVSTINGAYHLKFDAKLFSALATGSTLQVGTLDSNTNVANFSPVGTAVSPTTTNQTFTSIAIPATTGHQYVAIKFTPAGNHSTVLVDNIVWEAAPCVPVATFLETFDSFTAFPEKCWTGTNFSASDITMKTISGTNKGLQLYSGFATGDIIVASPEVSTIDGNHLLSFDIASINIPGSTIQVGTMTDNTDFTTFSAVGTPFAPIAGTTHQTAKIPANTGHKYVAIKFIHGGGHKALVLDNVEWTTTASTPKFDTSKVTVYPNPTSGIFNVDSELNIAQIEVFNSTGQKVLTTANKEINLQNAANGLYFVTVTTNEGTQGTYKLIKK